jgi:glycine/sarcosine N-methyltransferase
MNTDELPTDNPVADFYDQLAPHYSLMFADWTKSINYQAEVLDRLITSCGVSMDPKGSEGPALLDCACGVGTQDIGLALRGYSVHATDVSRQAVRQAKTAAKQLNSSLTFGVADFRSLETQVPGLFDIVLCCDNALPHLLTPEDLLLAIKSMRSKLRPGGLLLASIRDYDRIMQDKPSLDMPRVLEGPAGRRIVFQLWDWEPDSPLYSFNHFILIEGNERWDTIQARSKYRALRRGELDSILEEAGFTSIEWHMPEQSGYYQPIVAART